MYLYTVHTFECLRLDPNVFIPACAFLQSHLCLCLCLYPCIMHMLVCMSLHAQWMLIYTPMCVSVLHHMSLRICIHYTYVHMLVCISVCANMCACICTYIYISLCLDPHQCEHLYLYVSLLQLYLSHNCEGSFLHMCIHFAHEAMCTPK